MKMSHDDALCFVQFIHPGPEHCPDASRLRTWNRDPKHKRKFLLSQGRAVYDREVLDTELVFWGEWEPESEVVEEIHQPLMHGPRYIYRPYYVLPHSYAGLQNTDPFVFDAFLFWSCQQHTSKGPTQLRNLQRGSVILFGSYMNDKFVLDTVFVVRDWIDYDLTSYKSVLNGRVPLGYMEVTMNPLFLSGRGSKEGCPADTIPYRLYFGATYASPIHGMFSFFPCQPYKKGTLGFARPTILDADFITNTQRQKYRLNPQDAQGQVCEYWHSVVKQVLARDLWQGIHAQMPELRRI
jgi:hypothetical protein